MGTKWVLHFDDEIFLTSINKAKWNIYAVALQDLILYSLSYLKVFYNYQETEKANEIYEIILNKELKIECRKKLFYYQKRIFWKD